MKTFLRLMAALVLVLGLSQTAQAGNIYLTGHDVLLHSGQRGYDGVILDYLRGVGSGSVEAKAGYSISVVGSGSGFAQFTGGPVITGGVVPVTGKVLANTGAISGYGTVKYYQTGTGASWTDILSADALVILSHTSCGGCDTSTAGSAEINANSAAIAARFNAGMDIWGNSGATLSTYYDFLPAGAVASGASISGSSGFTATAAGTAIGIVDPVPGVSTATSMINGFPTHNRFFGFDPAFTVYETRGAENISIGIQGASIVTGGIVTGTVIPEPTTMALLGLGCAGAGLARRRRKAKVAKKAA